VWFLADVGDGVEVGADGEEDGVCVGETLDVLVRVLDGKGRGSKVPAERLPLAAEVMVLYCFVFLLHITC
jgi:hypothetical protein